MLSFNFFSVPRGSIEVRPIWRVKSESSQNGPRNLVLNFQILDLTIFYSCLYRCTVYIYIYIFFFGIYINTYIYNYLHASKHTYNQYLYTYTYNICKLYRAVRSSSNHQNDITNSKSGCFGFSPLSTSLRARPTSCEIIP